MYRKRIIYGIWAALFDLGLCLEIPVLFPDGGINSWLVLLFSLLLLSALLIATAHPKGHYVTYLVPLLVIVVMLIGQKQMLQSFGTLVNDLQECWIRNQGRVVLAYDASGKGMGAMLILVSLLQLLIVLAVLRGANWLFSLIYLPWGILLGLGYPLTWPGLLCILMSLFLFWGQGKKIEAENLKRNLARVLLLLASAAVLSGIMFSVGKPDVERLQESCSRYLHERKYDSDSNSMPEGDLLHVGEWKKSDEPALEVTMERPEKAYLRGHCYNNYTGSGWKQMPVSSPRESSDLFYWLHKQDFYGTTQLSKALALTAKPEWSQMSVKNLSACRENSYLPYGYADSSQLDAALIGDGHAAGGIDSFIISSGGLSDWYKAQKRLVKKQKKEDFQDYLSLENAYRQFVYEEDLELPEEAVQVLDRQLGGNQDKLTMDEIQKHIYDYLSACMSYEEDVDPMEQGDNFLEYLLEENPEGYSVHYATAAVLMLRYYGVPARYVEGYFLSRADAASMEAGKPFTLTEEHAHAWAEYYLEGVGFVPFEVTPGYIDEEDLDSAEGADSNQNNNQYSGKRTKSKDYDKPEVEPKEEDPGSLPVGIWILLGFCILLLLILLILIIGRQLKLRRFLKELDGKNAAEAVSDNYAYAMLLMSQAHKKSNGWADDPVHEEARLLNQEAMFSNHKLSDKQRLQMTVYRQKTLTECKKSWSLGQRIRYKLWRGLY